LTLNQYNANVLITMASALRQKSETITQHPGHRRVQERKGGLHASRKNSHISTDALQTAPEVTRTRRGRTGKAAGIVTVGLLAAVAPSHLTGESGTPSSPVITVASGVRGIAKTAMEIYNLSEAANLGYDQVADKGRRATIWLTSKRQGAVKITVDGTETQRDIFGRLEPDPEGVTAVSVTELKPGGESASFSVAGGAWTVTHTRSTDEHMVQMVTEVGGGILDTKGYIKPGNRSPSLKENIPGYTSAMSNIATALHFAQQFDAQNIAPVEPLPREV
jgi:hypothetical protein